jgi:hypothetical protein
MLAMHLNAASPCRCRTPSVRQVAQLRDLVMKEFDHVSKPTDECPDVL